LRETILSLYLKSYPKVDHSSFVLLSRVRNSPLEEVKGKFGKFRVLPGVEVTDLSQANLPRLAACLVIGKSFKQVTEEDIASSCSLLITSELFSERSLGEIVAETMKEVV
jgi:hypothetical protein